jgi:hypothetical protein
VRHRFDAVRRVARLSRSLVFMARTAAPVKQNLIPGTFQRLKAVRNYLKYKRFSRSDFPNRRKGMQRRFGPRRPARLLTSARRSQPRENKLCGGPKAVRGSRTAIDPIDADGRGEGQFRNDEAGERAMAEIRFVSPEL